VARVGIDDLAVLRRIVRVFARLGPHVDKTVVGLREAEGQRRLHLVQVVGAAAKNVRERDGVVDVDERVDRRQPVARLDALDQPFDGRAIAGLLDAEPLVGGAPCGDARDRRELDTLPARPARRLALREERIELRIARLG
jgi:hypothetical protein